MSWPANINVLRQLTSQSEMSALQRTKMYSIVTKGNSLPKPIESVNIYIKFQPFPRRYVCHNLSFFTFCLLFNEYVED